MAEPIKNLTPLLTELMDIQPIQCAETADILSIYQQSKNIIDMTNQALGRGFEVSIIPSSSNTVNIIAHDCIYPTTSQI